MTTTDLWFASYLKNNNYELESYEVTSRGRGSYSFKISEDDYRKEKLNFFNSDLSKLKQIMQELKDLVY